MEQFVPASNQWNRKKKCQVNAKSTDSWGDRLMDFLDAGRPVAGEFTVMFRRGHNDECAKHRAQEHRRISEHSPSLITHAPVQLYKFL